ncbi:heterokaryon incompatibility protein-domain-containing protein [Tricladium varicosporioides]|nr:heterokaryon incompatibility protein-domain-containing protein [Hymenoscyphus varicosporioides]
MSTVQPYLYSPLVESKHEIRLVYIFNLEEISFLAKTIKDNPDLQDDPDRIREIENAFPVKCTINSHSLDEKPGYVALSYTWGDASKKKRLIVEEQGQEFELQITENLDLALRHLNIDGYLWIDAVCINQTDDEEKSWQVRQMWQVYEYAKYTASWLGPAADDSDKVIKQMAKAAMEYQKQMQGKSILERKQMNWTPPEDFLSLPAFSALTKRPYWRRVWIQQEIYASDNVWFHCGSAKTHSTLVALTLRFLNTMHERLRRQGLGAVDRESFQAYLGTMKASEDMRLTASSILRKSSLEINGKMTLAVLLKSLYVIGKGLQASDPRDYLFGFLSMATDSQSLGIIPDYRKPKEQIFVELAIALINHMGLEILSWSNFQDSVKTGTSWAPDWSLPILRPYRDFGWNARKNTKCNYQASGNSTQQFRFLTTTGHPYPKLIICGILADIIKLPGQTSMVIPVSSLDWYEYDQDPDLNLPTQWISDIRQLSIHCGSTYSSPRYPNGTQEAIWRTLIANMEFSPEGKHQPANPNLEKGFKLCEAGTLRATMKAHEFHRRKKDFEIASKYWRPMVSRCSGRRLFVTGKGFLGLGPRDVKSGDVLVVFLGVDVPFVLRRQGDECYEVVGEAYVHGIMDGEMMVDSAMCEFKIC